MRWSRLYNNEAESRHVRIVAADAGVPPVTVLGVLFAMKCHASDQRDEKRGTLAGWDDRVVAFDLGIEPAMLKRIRIAMEGRYLDGQRIINWDLMQYASDGSTERWKRWRDKRAQEKQEDTAAPTLDQRLTNAEPTLDQRVRTEQSRAEQKKSASHSPSSRTRADAAPDADFDRFWTLYPRKVGKGAARKAWAAALRRADEGAASIIAGITVQTSLDRFDTRDDGRFIPHPATWLNADRWLDGMEPELGETLLDRRTSP